jgi:hypothetical protein
LETAPSQPPAAEGETPVPTPESAEAPPAPAPAPTPEFASVSGATGTPSAPSSATPNAIGDFFCNLASSHDHTPILFVSPFGSTEIPKPACSVVGRIKASENNNPLPADRVFLDYAAYENVPLTSTSVDVQRFVPGFERTIFDGMMSVELRMPFAQTLDNRVSDTSDFGDSWEIGNLYTAVKTLLYQDDALALSAGLGITAPTAEDLEFDLGGATGRVENNSVHLLPYFGLLHLPNDTFYTQAYIQVDVDANGNPITITAPGVDDTIAVVQDQTLLFGDLIVGAWLYDNPSSNGLQGVVGATELHYTTAVKDFDSFDTGATSLTAAATDDFDFLTGIMGIHLLYAGGAQVTFAYGVPLMSHRFADGEFRMMLNWGAPLGLAGSPYSIGR